MKLLKILGIENKNEIIRKMKVITCADRMKPIYIEDGILMFIDHISSAAI